MALQTMILGLWSNFLAFLPSIITTMLILLIGFIIGNVASRVVKEMFVRIRIDNFVKKKEKFNLSLSDMSSTVTKWALYILFLEMGIIALGVPELTAIVTSAVSFLLGAVGAVVIILVGYVFACFVKDHVIESKTLYGDIIGNLIFFLIVYVSVALALPFVKIDPTLVNWLLIVIMASLGLGLALAIGFGLKDIVAESAREYSKKYKKR